MDEPNANGWQEWSRYVLAELKRLNECLEKLENKMDVLKDDFNDKISNLSSEIKLLKMKSGLWGFAGAAIPIAIMIALQLLMKGN